MRFRHHKYPILIIALTFMVSSKAFCDRWDGAQEHAQRYAEQAQNDAAQVATMVDRQRQQLLKEISILEESMREEEAKLDESKAQFDSLLQKEQSIQAILQQEERDAARVLEVYLAVQKEVETMLRSSLIYAQNLSFKANTGEPNGPDNALSFADLQQLADALFTEMESSGKIQRSQGSFIGPQGTEVKGEILRLGDVNAFYRRPGEAGFLEIDKVSGKLVGIPATSSWFDRNEKRINQFFDGEGDVLPMDLSRGEIFTQYANGHTLVEWLRSGGLLVWPILLVGLVAFLLIIERFIFLMRTKANSEKLMAKIQHLAANDHWQECRESCSNHAQASVCRVLQAGLRSLGSSREVLENELQEAIMKELPRLERFLSTISVLAAVAPLLGLLGTVSGMINTFHAITLHGTGDPRMLSGGISEALITTQLGLMVAVPVMILHHFLERRVDAIVGEMEEKSTALTVIMLKNRGVNVGSVSRAA